MRDDRGSATALLVATGLVFLAHDQGAQHPVTAEARSLGEWVLDRQSWRSRFVLRAIDWRWFRWLVRWVERATVPEIFAHYLERKRLLELLTESALAGGCDQLIVLGAGFDALACRIARHHGEALVMELDHPATQRVKESALQGCALGRDNLVLRPLDLTKPTAEFPRPQRPTVWIAEGLLMYLEEERVEDVLRSVRAASPPGSRLGVTYMELQGDGHPDFRRSSPWVHRWLASTREPFAWGIRPDELGAFLEKLGWRLLAPPPKLADQLERLAIGERIAWAETMP